MPGCPDCIVKLLLLIWCFKDKLNNDDDDNDDSVAEPYIFSGMRDRRYLEAHARIFYWGFRADRDALNSHIACFGH